MKACQTVLIEETGENNSEHQVTGNYRTSLQPDSSQEHLLCVDPWNLCAQLLTESKRICQYTIKVTLPLK